jgi:hypothetical protein
VEVKLKVAQSYTKAAAGKGITRDKKKPAASSGLNLFSWRRIEETVSSCCIARDFANLSS